MPFETKYFEREGRENLSECIAHSLEACVEFRSKTLVIFTATGHGIYAALTAKSQRSEFSEIRLVAVTFPTEYVKKPVLADDDETKKIFASLGVPVVSSHLPFSPIAVEGEAEAATRSVPRRVLSIFGGGTALCVEAIAMARDQAAIGHQELVVSATADTAILASATTSGKLFDPAEGMIVHRFLCKPMTYEHTRPHQFPGRREQLPPPVEAVVPGVEAVVPGRAVEPAKSKKATALEKPKAEKPTE